MFFLRLILCKENIFSFRKVRNMEYLVNHVEGINKLLARYGVKFGIYKNQTFHEQLFPFDAIPRIITKNDFALLEKGLIFIDGFQMNILIQ